MRLVSVFLMVALVLLSASVVMAGNEKPFVQPVPGTRGDLDCSNAIPIICGETVMGDNTGMPNNVETYSCVGWTESGGEVVYELTLPGPDDWEITVTTDFGWDPDLDVFLLGSCDEADCIDYGDTGFVTDCIPPGTYYIVVDGYGGDEGAYEMTVECMICEGPADPCDFPPHDTCEEAIVFCGDVSFRCIDTNYMMGNDLDPGSGGCTGYSAQGPDVVYQVTLLPGGTITASMDPVNGFDASMYLITDCSDPVNSCVIGDDSGNPEGFTYTSAEGGVYYLVADTYSSYNDGGEFTLVIDIMGGGASAVESATWSTIKALYR
ncbi:MAG: hypothetical protein KAW17_12380 [Candidatus Eisenbacteria sp.]|nr:hypothetical protein [Candidatus Eisenbacteria bacterium]